METSYGYLSLLPPLIAVTAALLSRNVILSLALGVFSGYFIMDHALWASLMDMAVGIGALFQKGWVLKTLTFALFVGSVIELIRLGGGVDALIDLLQRRKAWVTNRRRAELVPFLIGLAIFIESSITSLIAGTVGRPLFDRFGISREKLAYICDSTAAPVCTMFPLNAWGALLLGLVGAQIDAGVIQGSALDILIHALAFNFYAFFSILLVLFTIIKGIDFPSTTKVESDLKLTPSSQRGTPAALWVPILSLLALVIAALFISGGGNPLKGSGSTAVFTGVMGSVVLTALYFRFKRLAPDREIVAAIWRGVRAMSPIVAILIFAFAIGDVTVKMGTGPYLAAYASQIMHPVLLPAGIFLLSAVIAFATGTSWGTFSIMMPIAITMAAGMGMENPTLLYLSVAAVISGGVFGDHASPISDTTIIAAMAAGCDLIAHVKTQLPWALLAAFSALIMFLAMGWMIV